MICEVMQNKTYIYALTESINDKIRYIGKSNNPKKRYNIHTFYEKGKNYKNSWIKSLKNKGLIPNIKIIEECDKNNWQEREIFWINFYKNAGARLTNLTNGGDGLNNPSEETKRKISENSKKLWQNEEYRKKHKLERKKRYSNKEYRKKLSDIMKKTQNKPENRKKQSNTMKMLFQNPEFRKKHAETHKNHSEETKRKISEANKGKTRNKGFRHTEQSKRKMSEAHIGNNSRKGKKCTENTKRKISKKLLEFNKNNKMSQETRQKIGKASKLRWQSSEYRKKISQKMIEKCKNRKPISEETRRKMSKAHKDKKRGSYKKNVRY